MTGDELAWMSIYVINGLARQAEQPQGRPTSDAVPSWCIAVSCHEMGLTSTWEGTDLKATKRRYREFVGIRQETCRITMGDSRKTTPMSGRRAGLDPRALPSSQCVQLRRGRIWLL